ncbi:unnamed protein product, partial [Tetraodon nigroviridis]
MGNVCGCVRVPKEECYVDPKSAPLRRESNEPQGRRYFQRQKRKPDFSQPVESLNNLGYEAVVSEAVGISGAPHGETAEEETRQESLSRGIYEGKAPVFVHRGSPHQPQEEVTPKTSIDDDKSRSTVDKRLHDCSRTPRVAPGREALLDKERMGRQLSRSASFGAVEHTLQTLGFSDVDRFAKMMWGCQANGRWRASSCSGHVHYPVSADHKISEIHVTGESEDMTAKERLLLWSRQLSDGYVGVRCENFTTSWRDGRLFNAIIHKYRPDMVDMTRVSAQTNRSNLEQAFCVAEQLGVPRLLDPEDVDVQSPDEKSVITYVSTLYDAFPKVPEGADGISPNDIDIKWVEYQNMIKYLSQWIKHNVAVMSDRSFPNNPVELKALYSQYLHFKEYDIPLKETEKTKINSLYKMLEMWIEFGRIQLPPGHHPNDIEKEWGKLIVAMLEREKSLRPEVERLETLQQIANRVQRDCVNGEDKLALARTALQSDTKRLESGIQFINEAEIASYLLECENILRQQVVDIQVLLDGKFPFADQLVQRVSKLRDDLLALRADCSSLYSKGRTLTTEQTKMMISGITQSLNSGFSQNTSLTPALTSALTPGGLGTPGSTLTSCLTPSLSPSMNSGLQPSSVQSFLDSSGGKNPSSLLHLKHMQISKPLQKSSVADPSMTEEEVNMRFIQDLLTWVEEMQLQLDHSEWGNDLPSVETHIDNHSSVHRAIEEFQMSLKDAKLSEIQMNPPLKRTYSEKLNKLEKQYEILLGCSRERQSHLESLHDFVSQATQELIWLNEKEEEEVAFDWSDRNSSISKKREYHSDLMREMDEKESVFKSVQNKGEQLVCKNHPAKATIEAYKAAMQTQWSWILQLCSCVEQHLKENAAYFEASFHDAKEAMDFLKNLEGSIERKYSCDQTSSLHRLEDLIQESMDEKEQLLQYRSTVAGLVGRAKNIVQLRPRNPESPIRSSIPVKAVCNYRQIEITIHRDEECELTSNSHRAKWKVISPAGNEAMVPSVCFTVPPPNKEAADVAAKTEQLYQTVMALWHHSHINMKSVVSWHYLMADVRAIRNWNVASIKTMLPGEHQQVLSNLQSHFDEFLRDSEESEVFTVVDRAELEKDVLACKEYYQELLQSAERGKPPTCSMGAKKEHEESVYNCYISELRNFRMLVEAHEEHLIRQLRTPLERDDLEQSLQRISEHEKKTTELNELKEDLDVLKEKCELFLRQAAASPSVSKLSSELTVLLQSMSQVYSMSSIYMDKLKTVSLVVKHSQSAEALVKTYESKLYEEDAMNPDIKSIESAISTLKQWQTEIDEKQEVFHNMEDELQKARLISDRMFKVHNERDFDLDWHKERADQLSERWQNIHSQIDSRLRDLDGIGKSLQNYRDSYCSLDKWVRETEAEQLKTQENKPEDSRSLAGLLNKLKVLVAEIEQKQSQIDECQKHSEQYSSAIKDYELQLMTFRAMVDSQHKSPVKKRRMQNSSDAIQQEFMDLRTRYTALVTLITQYVKFASETLKRAEDEERSADEEKREHGDKVSKLLHWVSSVQQTSNNNENARRDSNANTDASKTPQVSVEEMVTKKEQVAEALRATQMILHKHSEKMTEEERGKAQEQLKALNQAYNELSQHCSDHNNSAEEDYKSTNAGLAPASTNVLVDQLSVASLPETRPLTCDPFQADPHFCLDWSYPLDQEAMFESSLHHSPALNEPNNCVLSSYTSSLMLSDTAAARKKTTGEDVVIKVIEVKTDSDGVNVAYTGEIISLERAFQSGLIVASDYAKVLESQKTPQDAAEDVSQCEPVQEVNSLVSRCLSGNNSPISLKNAHALKLSSPQLNAGDLNECQDTEKLNVDAAVQCDLMSSSSTLIVLGSQQQYLGLVLPTSEEVQMTSKTDEKLSAAAEFTSNLFSKKEKIAAFYIPEFSEVVDFDVAVHKGLIDSYTAELLKTVEIPDVVPDVDHLNEKFSSWLMYRKLIVDGCFHAADCLKVDSIPSLSEAEQLFISYLMINSYVDAQTEKRVVILDRELRKMVKVFLEDPVSSEDCVTQTTSLELNISSRLERADKVCMNEETDMEMEEQHTREPPCFVSSGNGRVSFRVEPHTGDQAVNHHPVLDATGDNSINVDERDPNAAEKSVCLKNTDWTKSGEFVQMIYRNDSHTDGGGSGNSPNQTPQHTTEPICSGLEFPHPEDLLDDEQDFVIEVLEAHVEEEDFSDIPSVRHTEKNAAPSQNPMDQEAFLKLLNSHSDDRESTEEWDTMSDFQENVFGGHNSSYSAYFLSEKQTISRSGCAVSISESFQAGITKDEFVGSDPETSMYPQGDLPCTSRSDTLAFMDANLPGKQPAVRKVMAKGAAQDAEIGGEITDREVDYETGNVEEMSRYLHRCLPADDDHGSQMFPHSPWNQDTAECIRHAIKSSLPTDRRDSRDVSSSQATGAADKGENCQSSDERVNSGSQTRHATFPARPDSDSPPYVEKVLITESDSEEETRENSECESDALSHVLAYVNEVTETERSALQMHLRSGPTVSGCYSSPGAESAIMSDSSTEDGTRVTSPQPTEDDSQKVFCVKQKAGQQFPGSASSSDDIIVPERFERLTDGGSEREEPQTAIRTSPEAEPVDQDMPGSQGSSVNAELSTSFSLERQRGKSFRVSSDGEWICFLEPPVTGDGDVALEQMSSDQAETAVRVHSGCETPGEKSSRAERASEHAPLCQTNLPDVPSDCCLPPDAPSEVSGRVKTCSGEASDVGDPQSAADVEDTHSILSNTSKPRDTHNTHNLEDKEGQDSLEEGEVSEKTEEFPSIQQRLLHVFKTVASSQDLSMVQEVMQSLNLALGSNTGEVHRHLDSIKEENSEGEDEGSAEEDTTQPPSSSDSCKVKQTEKDYLECVGRLQDHCDALDDIRKDLLIQTNLGKNMEELQTQVEECQALESQLSRLTSGLYKDMKKARELLNSSDEAIPAQIRQDLAAAHMELETSFNAVSQMCAERNHTLTQAMDTGKDLERNLQSETKAKLDDVTFDIQCFISENMQFLSSAQSSRLLKSLSSAQRGFRDQAEMLVSQRSAWDVLLETREREDQEKILLAKQKEFTEKLEEVCSNLTQTENHLIGHQQQAENAKSVSDLQQYQQEHQALQKDVLTNASALNEVISSTKRFLEENRSKLTPDQITVLESKLDEAKSKAKLIDQRAEESRKDLEKVVTTAIKQESEKAAAVEKLEESKNKIEGLLDWITNIGNENRSGLDQSDLISKENGNLPAVTSAEGLIRMDDDDTNGNALQTTEKDFGREAIGKPDASLDLDKQYDRVKAHHKEILSQQQDLIMATQSAQALLDKQANMLTPEEKEKLQKSIQELKGRYDTSLTQAEQQMKQVQCIQEELKKFQSDIEEFDGWLDQAEHDMEDLGAPESCVDDLIAKVQRQKSFSEDVISHKGDLRFITMSGQKVLDVAAACGSVDPVEKNVQQHVDTSETCAAVKDQLDSAASRYKMLHSQCTLLGNNLKDVVEKYKKYEDSSTGLLKWLSISEEEARKQQSEAIAADPKTLQTQLEETKARRQAAKLYDVVERYDNLSKSVSDRNEKLQITLTRSMSVQDGLDEMMRWMEAVEASVEEKGPVPLDAASIGDILSKEAALEQDIASRQSSISAMKAKVKKFVETADPSAAALLHSKMDTLCQRFSDACDNHRQKVSKLEQLKEKVEKFEELADKVQQFVVKRSQDLHETDGPGKTFTELSQLMQNTKAKMAEHVGDVETLQKLSKELSEMNPDGNRAQIQSRMENLSNIFSTFQDTVKEQLSMNTRARDQQCPSSSPSSYPLPKQKPTHQNIFRGRELTVIQQNMSFVNEGYESLGERLKRRAAELKSSVHDFKEAKKDTDTMITWLQNMKKTAASWNNSDGQKDSVKTQLEQQKVFEDDMKQKQEQLQKLREKLLNLIKTYPNSPEAAKWKQMLAEIGNRDPSNGKLVKEQLTALTQKWQGLTGQLDQRDGLIDQAVVKTGDFQALLNSLGRTTAQLENQLANQQGHSTQPDALKKQLEDVQNISVQLREERKKLREAEAISTELTTMVTEDYLKADLARQLENVSKPFKQLEEKAAKRIEQLNSTFASSQQFHQTSKDFQTWLSEKLRDQLKPQAVSAKADTLQQSLEEHNKLQEVLSQHEEAYNTTMREGEMLLHGTEGAEKLALQGQLTSLSSNWDELKRSAAECEACENRVKLTVDPVAVESSISQVKALQKDVDKHRGMMEQLNAAVDSLLEVANTDTEAVKEDKASIGKRVEGVAEALQSKRESLEKIAHKVKDFNDIYKEAKDQLKGAEKQADSMEKDYSALNKKLEETCQVMEGKLQGIGQFQNNIREMFTRFTDLDDELDSMAPAALQLVPLKEQQDSLDSFVAKLRELMANTANAGDSCKKMLETEASPDLLGLKRDLDALSKQCGKLMDRAKGRELQMDGKLCGAVAKEESQAAVGMETDIINQQLEAFKGEEEDLNIDDCYVPQRSIYDTVLLNEQIDSSSKGSLSSRHFTGTLPYTHRTLDLSSLCGNGGLSASSSFELRSRKPAPLDERVVFDGLKLNGHVMRVTDTVLPKSRLQGGDKPHHRRSWRTFAPTSLGEYASRSGTLGSGSTERPGLMGSRRGQSMTNSLTSEEDSGLYSPTVERERHARSHKRAGPSVRSLSSSEAMHISGDLRAGRSLSSGQEEFPFSPVRDSQSLYYSSSLVKETRPTATTLLDGKDSFRNGEHKYSTGRNSTGSATRTQNDISGWHSKTLPDYDEQSTAELSEDASAPDNCELVTVVAFQKEDIDPLQMQLQDINSLGQGLIQTAANGASTKKLEYDLEEVNTKWNTLNKKIAERSAQLHKALLHCGRFQDALESLLSWLTDTEELVANQKPPSAEFKVVKAQIQEQKLLQRLLDDRKPTVELIKKEGGKVAELTESVDKEKVAKEIECLGQRWDALLKKAENRHKQLESILVVTQQFHETLEPLSEWLGATEKHLINSEPIGTETSKLEDQISQHKALEEEIMNHSKDLFQAVSLGQMLRTVSSVDDKEFVQSKLDTAQAGYIELQERCRRKAEMLQQALANAQLFGKDEVALMNWLSEVHTRLNEVSVEECKIDVLENQLAEQRALLKEAMKQKPLVDKLNELSSSLLDLIPWHTREGLDRMVTEDNERYRAFCEAAAQQVEQMDADLLKSQQFEQAADTELSWITGAKRKLLSMGEIRLEPDQTTAQLQAQKVMFAMDIMRHKDAVDDIVKTGKCIMNSKSLEEKEILKAKTQSLLEEYAVVSQLNSERCLQLERAHSLASQFWETYEEMWPWLQETLSTFTQLPPPAIEYDTLRQQQEELRQMRELIAEHKPHIDKMNKTGPQLLELSPVEGVPIREKYTVTDQLYTQLKADVKQRAATLDEAISKSTQFHDKIDPMLESLDRIAERLRQPPSISVEVDKIREQIAENKAVSVDLEKLQPLYETLKQRGEEMIARSEGADKGYFCQSDIQALQEEREAKLLDVMDLADKFWCDHCALIITIKDSQDLLRKLEEPGVDPSVVKQQQEFVEGFKEEIDVLQEELDVVQNQGAELLTACGEPDKPVIKKSIDEVNSAWENLNKTWKERAERLEEAMQAAVQFQDGLQGMFDWVDILESKLDSMSPVGTDLETVKQQIVELKEFKEEAYQLQIEMERLNHQAGLLLKKVTEEADRCAIQEPMSELKMLWDNLDEKIIGRQHKLERGLLALGQFQHALDELLAWMSHTEELLNEQRKAGGDPKAIEIELAKHHVLQNDVLAHEATVETVNKAGNDLVESSAGEEASSLQSKLENLNQRWKAILEKTEQRKLQLKTALLQAQGFHGEIEDMQQWLKDTERQLLASKAVGGLPDTAREQLNAHLELCSAFESKEELYQELLNKGQQLLALTPEGPDSNTEQDLANLKDKWEAVEGKITERKVKLEEALELATDFHNSLQDFINWLTQAEQTLNTVSSASLILETIMFQIDEHKMFVTEVNSHRDHIIELDQTGTHLKYFSQKQDVVLIKNLLLSVQGRWEKLVQRSVERGRQLDDARKRAKQFHENWNKLMEWLDESEKNLDSDVEIANEPDKIKTQLLQHKEFQKALGSKHSVYDTTARTGRALKEKTTLKDDNQKLDDMLSELRDRWDTVCGKSVERQNKLEEALLFSGQFTDALQALIDWLYRVEPQLAEDQPVHGDIDLVLNLIDNHKVFQKELGKRTVSVQALKRSARELIESSHDDSSWVKVQMQELSTRWESVCNLSVSKQARLEQALCQAEEFHSTVHILLEWLAEAEQSLRFHGSLPDDEEALQALIEQHKEFMKKLEEKRAALNKATSMGEAILTICHPDSITTIKHWNTIIKARFEEVQAWARQHQQRLAAAFTELLATQELLENLLSWLHWAETNLNDKDKEPLPQEIEEVKSLIAEHQAFMEEMTRKQPDVDKITKTHKRKAAVETQNQSQIPVLGKGRAGRKRSPTQTMYVSATQAPIETKNPQVNLLVTKWQHVWLLALDRRRKLNDSMDRLEELKEFANFDFDVWRKRYMRWMNHKKSRVMDFFRRIDKDQDGKVTRQEFIEGILSSKFPTSRLEMSAVADIFDRDGDGYIDYYEFVAALHPNKDAYKPLTDADKIEDEVTRQVAKCKCPKRFQVEQIGANKYRFGDSQQLRLVRILRSTVMVRVGGGWMALDEFLVKNDPCRAKGRTNVELREKFILPEGTTQVMASFRYRGRRSRPSSRGASPNRSTSSQSCPVPLNPAPLTTSVKVTPVQGSKLRLPGYLSGKGFQSGEEGTLISAAVLKARNQTLGETRRNSSRPGSKAGSRGSSRRGSDASDFDISDIQSVCSDASETVGEATRGTPRSASRQQGGRPSKIPTPQRRTTPTSKLAKGSRR